jgi:hypothetical protein
VVKFQFTATASYSQLQPATAANWNLIMVAPCSGFVLQGQGIKGEWGKVGSSGVDEHVRCDLLATAAPKNTGSTLSAHTTTYDFLRTARWVQGIKEGEWRVGGLSDGI